MIDSIESARKADQGPWVVVLNEMDGGFASGWRPVTVEGDLYDPKTAIIRIPEQVEGTDFYSAYVAAQMVAAALRIRQGTALKSDRDMVAIAHRPKRMVVTQPMVPGETTLGQAARSARLALLGMSGE